MWDCDVCKHRAKEGFISCTCLDCKREYPGQEAEDYKPDRFEQQEEAEAQEYPMLEKLNFKKEGSIWHMQKKPLCLCQRVKLT